MPLIDSSGVHSVLTQAPNLLSRFIIQIVFRPPSTLHLRNILPFSIISPFSTISPFSIPLHPNKMQFSVRVSLLLAAMQLLLAITVLSGTGAASPVQARDGPDLWDWLDAADYLDELDSLMLELGFGPGSGGLERIERDWDDAPQYGYQVPGSGGADLNIHGGKDPLVWGWPQRHPDAYDRRSDLAFSADELDHEYAYGLVRSLVDPSGRCLVSPDTEGPGLTEGWADFSASPSHLCQPPCSILAC